VSFLIDGPWLYAMGRAYGARAPEHRQGATAAALGAATIAAFYGVSIPLYLDRPWTRPIWRACRANSGRDWMINSGVLRLPHRRPTATMHAVAAALFATYPLWLWLGHRHGRRARRTP
jgi:hypothetical protein